MTTELAERKADGKFDESVLRQPLEYITEGIYLCAQYVCDHHIHGSHRPEIMWGVSDYEKYLHEIGIQKPSGAPDWNTEGDYERMLNLACLLYVAHWRKFTSHFHMMSKTTHSTTLLRDIFGNPFRPVAFLDFWRSESAIALARTAYDTRNFSLLPILADALEDTGCNHPEVLNHCRDPQQVHVRGCWVVDGVLEKA